MQIAELKTYNDLELALMVLLGYLGTGDTRKKKLGSRYKDVQLLVNTIVNGNVPPGKSFLDTSQIEQALLHLEPSHDDYIKYVNDIISLLKEDTRK